MEGHSHPAVRGAGGRWPATATDKLDRALVAGLMLEVFLEAGPGSGDPQARRRRFKARLRDDLVSHLAGQITLDRFRGLVFNLEHWFSLYYPLIFADTPQPSSAPSDARTPRPSSERLGRGLREEVLRSWFQEHIRGFLPRRPHRKLSPEKLLEFLRATQGAWFRLKEFQDYFTVDRKTAWEYLQKFLAAGLLNHNGESSTAARYCLHDRFLKFRAEALRRRVAQALADLDRSAAAALADWLLATGGEAFWEHQCPVAGEAACRRKIISRLQDEEVLEELARSGSARLLRLARCWQQSEP